MGGLLSAESTRRFVDAWFEYSPLLERVRPWSEVSADVARLKTYEPLRRVSESPRSAARERTDSSRTSRSSQKSCSGRSGTGGQVSEALGMGGNWTHGDRDGLVGLEVELIMQRKRTPISVRLWAKCAIWPPTDCWLWQASIRKDGYGRIGVSRSAGVTVAHRVAYELVKGPIPKGLQLDHLCRNRSCINPAHLEAVTQGENLRRGISFLGGKTHCPQGHPYDAGNTYRALHPGSGYFGRHCKACMRNRAKARAKTS